MAQEKAEREERKPIRQIKLRYVEKLKTNKENSACFKSVTRKRRDEYSKQVKIPPVGHYTPKFNLVERVISDG